MASAPLFANYLVLDTASRSVVRFLVNIGGQLMLHVVLRQFDHLFFRITALPDSLVNVTFMRPRDDNRSFRDGREMPLIGVRHGQLSDPQRITFWKSSASRSLAR